MEEPVRPSLDREEDVYLNEDNILLGYFIFLAKYSRSILLVSAVAMIITALVLLISPNKYTAKACIMPPQQNVTLAASILDSLAIANSPANAPMGLGGVSGMLGLKSPGDIYVAMMEDDGICDRMIQRFNLREVYQEDVIELLRKQLRKQSDIRSGKEGLIFIEVTDEDPKRAADMANGFAEELDKMMLEMSRTDAKNYLFFLEQERDRASLKLASAEEALRNFSEKTSVLQIDAQTKGMIEYIANLRANIDAKEVQSQILQKKATPRNYDMVRLETEIKGLKEKLRAAESQAECIGDVCIATSKVPTLGLEYLRLYREAKYRETVYQLYGKLLELAHIDVARNVSAVQFVHRAAVPERRSNRRLKPTILAGFIAFFLMVGISYLREYSEKVKSTEKEAQRLAELRGYLQPYTRVLARIKNMSIRKKRTF